MTSSTNHPSTSDSVEAFDHLNSKLKSGLTVLFSALAFLAGPAFLGCGEEGEPSQVKDAVDTDAGAADAAPDEPPAPSEPLAGCDPGWPVTVHHGGAEVVDPQPADLPLACAVETGLAAVDSMVVATDKGTLFFSPAAAKGLARSFDNGASWEGPIFPPLAEQAGTPIHPWIWRDAGTGRIFFNFYDLSAGVCPDKTGTRLWYSDDEGESWESNLVGCDSWDWGKVITGPAATESRRAALESNGYPNVVYFCATGPTLIVGPNRMCYRSLDGGKTFERVADAVDSARDQKGWPNSGAVAPDGAVYIPHVSPNGLALSVSRDEGDSWNDIFVTGSVAAGSTPQNWLSQSVAIDGDGNIYVVWADDRDFMPYLSASRDAGGSWSEPVMIAVPEVACSGYLNVAVKQPGYVAVAYYGSSQAESNGGDGYFSSDGRPYNAYLAVTADLFADQPLFWTATYNDPAAPVIQGMSFAVSEFLGAPAFAPDGSIWAAFMQGGKGLAGRLTALPVFER